MYTYDNHFFALWGIRKQPVQIQQSNDVLVCYYIYHVQSMHILRVRVSSSIGRGKYDGAYHSFSSIAGVRHVVYQAGLRDTYHIYI